MQPIFFLFLLQTLAHANTHQPELFSFMSQVSERLMGCPLCLKPSSTTISFYFSSLAHTHKTKSISTLHFLHQWWGHNHLHTPGPSSLTSGVKSSKRFVPLSLFLAAKLPACTKFTLLASLLWSRMNSTAMKCQSSWMSFWLTQGKKVDGRRKSTRIRRGERFMAGI